jgi:hypothetical protein
MAAGDGAQRTGLVRAADVAAPTKTASSSTTLKALLA